MNRTAALFAALALVVAGVAVPAAGSPPAATGQATQLDAQNGTAEPAAPGARLAGVVAVQGAEVEGDLAARTFGIRIAQSNSNGSKAAVVGDRLTEVEARLATIEARREALEAAREDGNVSRARYEAEVTALAARSAALDRQLAQADAVSGDLPADVLAANGVDAAAIDELRTRAGDLRGGEVAAIARTIAGPGAGQGLTAAGNATGGPPDDRAGPPASPGRDQERDGDARGSGDGGTGGQGGAGR